MVNIAKFFKTSALLFFTAWSAVSLAGSTRKVIEVRLFEGGAGLNFFLHCARAYENEHTDVEVDLSGSPRMEKKLQIRILEGSWPEITNARLNYWNLIRNGKILALDEYLDSPINSTGTTWRATFLPGSLERYQYNGKTYGLPFYYSIYTVWYNKRMFAEHGWKTPTTIDEFLALCAKIKKSGIAPIAFQGRCPGYIKSVMDAAYYHLAGRKRFYDRQRLAPGSFDNPESIKAFEFVRKLSSEYFQPGAMGMSHTEAQLQFFLGNAAMIFCGSWLKSEMSGKIPDGFKLGTFNLPISDRSSPTATDVNVNSTYYFVMSESRHPALAVDFLKFMTSKKMAGEFAKTRDFPVAVKGANKGNLSKEMGELLSIIDNARTSYGIAPGEGFSEMRQVENDIRFDLLTGSVTPAQAANKLEDAARSIRALHAEPDKVRFKHPVKGALLLLLLLFGAAYAVWNSISRISRAKSSSSVPENASGRKMSWTDAAFFLAPAFLLYTVFVVAPSISSFAWSLYSWDGLGDKVFKGLLNFERLLFESDVFWIALENNLFLMFVVPLFVLPLSLFLATRISRGTRGAAFFKVIFFFPSILGVVAGSLLWMHMYNPQGGIINTLLCAVGLKSFAGFAWLSQEHLYWAIIPIYVWGGCGFNILLFLSAMENIPEELYEAADLEGASSWTQFSKITFPLIWEVFSIATVFMVIAGMKAFEQIWLLTNQSPTTRTHVIGTLMVQSIFQDFKTGQAAAIAVILFLIVFFGTSTTLRIMKRDTVEF